jgi:hypothetical protein
MTKRLTSIALPFLTVCSATAHPVQSDTLGLHHGFGAVACTLVCLLSAVIIVRHRFLL